ncbi:MAG: toprim domain-containing protein [Halothiobacillaceae bacterium]
MKFDPSEINRLRAIPLTAVLEHFGCEPDPSDPKYQFQSPVGRLSIDRQSQTRFYAHDIGVGGGGALDLAQLLQTSQLDKQDREAFKEAVQILGGSITPQAIERAQKSEQEAKATFSEPPKQSENPKHIEAVKDYLIEERKLSPGWVNRLFEQRKIFAGVSPQGFVNACFALDNGSIEQRGLSEKPFHGVAGEKGFWTLNIGKPERVVYVESAIDAVSYAEIAYKNKERNFSVVSITGSSREKLQSHVLENTNKGLKIQSAFDVDKAGENYHQRVLEVNPSATRLKPTMGKDWNDQLKVTKIMQQNPDVKTLVEKEINTRREKSVSR